MTNGEPDDWSLIGVNIRRARILRGYTQQDLAQRAKLAVTTVYHAERGKTLSRRTLAAICEGLGASVDHIRSRGRQHLTSDLNLLVHRHEESIWTADHDRRTKIPEDNLTRVQDPAERMRLGRLGLVSMFLHPAAFIMPEGPGPLFLELYGRAEGAINQTIYRDCLIICVEGEAKVAVADEVTTLRAGDLLGYRSKDLRWLEPVGTALPVRLTWVGSVRLGRLPTEFGDGVRVRPRRTS